MKPRVRRKDVRHDGGDTLCPIITCGGSMGKEYLGTRES